MNTVQKKELAKAAATIQKQVQFLQGGVLADFAEMATYVKTEAPVRHHTGRADYERLGKMLTVLDAGRRAVYGTGTFKEFVDMCVSQRNAFRTDVYDALESVYQVAGQEMPTAVEEKLLNYDEVLTSRLEDCVELLTSIGIAVERPAG